MNECSEGPMFSTINEANKALDRFMECKGYNSKCGHFTRPDGTRGPMVRFGRGSMQLMFSVDRAEVGWVVTAAWIRDSKQVTPLPVFLSNVRAYCANESNDVAQLAVVKCKVRSNCNVFDVKVDACGKTFCAKVIICLDGEDEWIWEGEEPPYFFCDNLEDSVIMTANSGSTEEMTWIATCS